MQNLFLWGCVTSLCALSVARSGLQAPSRLPRRYSVLYGQVRAVLCGFAALYVAGWTLRLPVTDTTVWSGRIAKTGPADLGATYQLILACELVGTALRLFECASYDPTAHSAWLTQEPAGQLTAAAAVYCLLRLLVRCVPVPTTSSVQWVHGLEQVWQAVDSSYPRPAAALAGAFVVAASYLLSGVRGARWCTTKAPLSLKSPQLHPILRVCCQLVLGHLATGVVPIVQTADSLAPDSILLCVFIVCAAYMKADRGSANSAGPQGWDEGGGSSAADQPPRLRVRIRDVEYDVTHYAKHHPGGALIRLFDVSKVPDATGVFDSFHHKSARAARALSRLPQTRCDVQRAPPGLSAASADASADFNTMVASWQLRGYYRGGRFEFVCWAFVVVAIVVLACHMCLSGMVVSGGCLLGIAWAQCGFVQHQAGHLAFTGVPAVDYVVQAFFESVLKGGSGRWWRRRHNKHHALTNSVEHDGDLRTTPFFAWDDELIQKVPTPLLRVQHLLFWPALVMYVPILATSVFRFVLRHRHLDELGLIALHFALACRLHDRGVGSASFVYFLGYAIQGVYLGCMFGMNHYAMPRVEHRDNMSWAEWQLTATCNWGVESRVAFYLSGFLNLQIEHHLASTMPAVHYHKIQKDVERYARRRKLPYTATTGRAAFGAMLRGLRTAGQLEHDRRRRQSRWS